MRLENFKIELFEEKTDEKSPINEKTKNRINTKLKYLFFIK